MSKIPNELLPVQVTLLRTAADLAQKEIGLEVDDPDVAATFEQLLERLRAHIEHLLEYRLEYLFSMLYLMDVDERLTRMALEPDQTEPAALLIARAVLQRLYQKALTRMEYSTGDCTGDWLPCESD